VYEYIELQALAYIETLERSTHKQ